MFLFLTLNKNCLLTIYCLNNQAELFWSFRLRHNTQWVLIVTCFNADLILIDLGREKFRQGLAYLKKVVYFEIICKYWPPMSRLILFSFLLLTALFSHFIDLIISANKYFEIKNKKSRTMSEICSKLTIKAPERP